MKKKFDNKVLFDNNKLMLKKTKRVSVLVLVVMALVVGSLSFVFSARHAKAAACAPTTDLGSVNLTNTYNFPSGSYQMWVRMKADTATATNDSVFLQLTDSAGTVQCYNVGDGGGVNATGWKFVNYQAGNTASKIAFNWSGANQSFKLIGREAGVKVDRVIITSSNDTCNPNEAGKENDPTQGNNCLAAPPLGVTISQPAQGSTVSGNVTISGSVANNSGAFTVSVRLNETNTKICDATVSGQNWTCVWNSTSTQNSLYNLVATVTNGTNKVDSSFTGIALNNVQTLGASITSPVGGANLSGTTTISGKVTNGTTAAKVTVSAGTTAISTCSNLTVSSGNWTCSWNTTTASNGTVSLTAKVTDGANTATSAPVSVTINNTNLSITFLQPANNATVQGNVTLNGDFVNSGSNAPTIKVINTADNVTICTATITNSNWSCSWNTSAVANGTYNLKVTITVGTASANATKTLNVSNPTNKAGDVNGDNSVNALDLSIVLSNWNKTGQSRAQGDLTGDGVVNALDLSQVLSNWGK